MRPDVVAYRFTYPDSRWVVLVCRLIHAVPVGVIVAVEDSVCGGQKLRCLQYHLDDVLVSVMSGTDNRVGVQVEDVHV